MGYETVTRRFAVLAILGLFAGGLNACSMGQTSDEEDSIELSGGPEGEEMAETDAAPAESAELAAAPEAAPAVEPAPPAAVEEPAPAPEAAPVVAKVEEPAPAPVAESPTSGSESYTVKSGDTLMRIAFESYGDVFSWRKIYKANQSQISDPNVLKAGVQLVIPQLEGRSPASIPEGSEKYQIQQGDTLGSISGKVYGDKSLWKRLWEQNKSWIKDPNKIFAGFFVYYTMTEEDRARVPASK